MRDEESRLARQMVLAYQASGIAARSQGGKFFVERETGWDGPLDATDAWLHFVSDIRAMEDRARQAASRVVIDLEPDELAFTRKFPGASSHFLRDPDRYARLGLDERRARIYASIAEHIQAWRDVEG